MTYSKNDCKNEYTIIKSKNKKYKEEEQMGVELKVATVITLLTSHWGLFATLFLHMSCSCYLEGLFAPLFLYMSHTPHILENPALITTLIHSFSSYYTHSLYIINHPTYFDLYIYTVVPII